MYSLSEMARELGRATVYLNRLQTVFALPVPADNDYARPYMIFLRQIIALRVLNVSEDLILKLWQLEKKLMVLLHVDMERSPTWFLDQCGRRKHPRRRLLLSNFDTGTDLFLRKLQPGLPLATQNNELFAGHEMGEDLMRVYGDYLKTYERIRQMATLQIRVVRAAATWANRLPQKMG